LRNKPILVKFKYFVLVRLRTFQPTLVRWYIRPLILNKTSLISTYTFWMEIQPLPGCVMVKGILQQCA